MNYYGCTEGLNLKKSMISGLFVTVIRPDYFDDGRLGNFELKLTFEG